MNYQIIYYIENNMTDILIASSILFAGIILAVIVNYIFKWLGKKAETTESKIDDILIMAIAKPASIAVFIAALYLSLTYVTLPPDYAWILESKYLYTALIIIATWIISVFVHNFIKLYGEWIASQTETELDDQIIDFLEVSARYIIWFIGFLVILSYLEINITPLIAGAEFLVLQ